MEKSRLDGNGFKLDVEAFRRDYPALYSNLEALLVSCHAVGAIPISSMPPERLDIIKRRDEVNPLIWNAVANIKSELSRNGLEGHRSDLLVTSIIRTIHKEHNIPDMFAAMLPQTPVYPFIN